MDSRHTVIDTALDEVTLVATGRSISGLYYRRHWPRPARAALGDRLPVNADPVLGAAAVQLREYLSGDRTAFDLPTRTDGDEFDERVWDLVRQIPRGATATYGQLAERLGDTLAQQVGQAVGRNPLSVIVPCHRVVGANGRLTGYAGGLSRKRFLLELEQPAPARVGTLF